MDLDIAMSGVKDAEVLMASYVEDNTSHDKSSIFDSGNTVHIRSHKELFNNFLVAKEDGVVIMMDGSACEVIDTGTIKVIERDRMVHALKVVWYVPEARYNLISIGVLDKKGCQIQVQQGIVTVSQGDRVMLEREKYGGLYKIKKENSVRGGVSRINLEGSSSRD